jgi:hypothetical protein
MSLRLRLVLLTLMLVALVAIALSALQVQTLVELLSEDTIARARLAGEQSSSYLQEKIQQEQLNYPGQDTPEQTKVTWTAIVENDRDIPNALLRTMTQLSIALTEINVADDAGKIVISTTPGLAGTQFRRRPSLAAWRQQPWYRRAYDLVTAQPDWEVTARPIGIAGTGVTVLQIQVVTSSLLLHDSLLAPVQRLATIRSALAISRARAAHNALCLAPTATHRAHH